MLAKNNHSMYLWVKTNLFILLVLTIHSSSLAQQKNKNKWVCGIGAGISKFNIKKANWHSGTINYADSLIDIKPKSVFKFDLILCYQLALSPYIQLRPSFLLIGNDGGNIEYQKKMGTETIKAVYVPMMLSCPVLLKLPSTKNKLYASVGPSLLFNSGQDDELKKKFKVKTFDLLADFGIGYDIAINKMFLTPELKYSVGFINMHQDQHNLYTNTIEKVNRQSVTLSFLLRDRL